MLDLPQTAIEDVTASKDKERAPKLKKMEKTIKNTEKSEHKLKTKTIVKDH